MDMQKKLDETYVPDKKGRKEKIVIALSGGLDSYVMAYLLKIQKYELIGVTVMNVWDNYPGDASKILSCHLTQEKLDEIKEFCHKLGISHHVIKELSQFKEEVVESWMADKVLGRFPTPCWNCHELRMKILHQTMVDMGAKYLATGHFAKLFHHESHGSVFVHTSNDEENDQASLLSRLPHEILNGLILPLSDLTKKEVLKLAENFGLIENESKIKIHQCFKWNDEMKQIFETKIPKKFRQDGDITGIDKASNLGHHEGVHFHALGETFNFRENGRPVTGYFGEFSYLDKRMVIVKEDFFKRDSLLLINCRFSEEVSWLEPIKGFLMIDGKTFIDCWIHPKTLATVYLELPEEHKFISGMVLSVLKKKGKNSKIYLTGEVQLLPPAPLDEDGNKIIPKINHGIDF
jgi:tRNA-specific 2-thiouridylase